MKFKTASVLLLALSCYACSDPSLIGSNFFNEGSLDVVYNDTITVRTSTVLIDSMVTSNSTRLLVGHHIDEDLGSLNCLAYFGLGPDNYSSLEETNTSYSRLSLILPYDGYSYYDTAITQTLFVHRLTKAITANDDGNLYNTSSIDYERIPLGQLSFNPYPNKLDSIEIPLTDELGLQLYTLSKSSSTQVSDPQEFAKLLRGVVVAADTSINGSILGFSTNAELRLYYNDKTLQPTEEKYLSFSIEGSSSSPGYFNSITSDRTKTALSTLETRKYPVSSETTNDRFYLQAGCGLLLKIELPYIKSILQDDENLILSSAWLEIKPIHNSDRINCALPSELTVYNINGKNELLSSFGTAQLIVDEYLDRDSYYYLDIKEYIKQQLAIDEFNSYALSLQLKDEDMASSVTRLYAGDQNSDNDLEIALHVVTVNIED